MLRCAMSPSVTKLHCVAKVAAANHMLKEDYADLWMPEKLKVVLMTYTLWEHTFNSSIVSIVVIDGTRQLDIQVINVIL